MGAKGYFDVDVTCEGPLARPPQACFLDGIQAATGATTGKRTLHWTPADRLVVRVKNTRTGKTAELLPAPALLELLGPLKPQANGKVGPGPSQPGHEQLEVVARRIAAMPDSQIASAHDGFNYRQARGQRRPRRQFIARHEATVRPLEIESNRCWWEANTTGSDAAFHKKEEIETRLNLLLANRQTFAELNAIKAQPIRDPLVARQIAVLYLQYLGQQIDPALIKEIAARSNAVEKAYGVYRAEVGGKRLTENEVRDVLRTSKDSARRRAVWEASKAVGPLLAPDLIKLAHLRNRAARQLGFKNFQVMQLALVELSQSQVLKIFDDLDALTRGPFHAAKAEIDAAVARRCGSEPPIVDKHLQHLSGGRIDVERHPRRNPFAANDLGGDREVAPSRICRGADVGLCDFEAFDFANGDDISRASTALRRAVRVR